MTMTRVEWNGMDLRIAREYGAAAAHYALWAPEAQLGKLWMYLRTAGATPVGSASLEAFRIAEGIPAYGIDMAERDCRRRLRRCGRSTSARAAIWARRSWSAFARAVTCTGICGSLSYLDLFPAAGVELGLAGEDGCRKDYERGRADAGIGQPRLCAGHDSRGSRTAQ
jgi:hypothetical protein